MKGGASPRQKGNRSERAITRYLLERGFAAERVPLSGSAGGSYLGDLTVPIIGISRVVEVKARANGFRQLYAWLADRDILIIKADRREPLVVLPLKLAAEIAARAGAR
jgi:Holliday junction resolvase